MKKSLIALAVLASVAGVAQAQSNVQLYGIVDVVIHKDKGADTMMTNGGVSNSRWGLKGSEDLGGGLKANFLLEAGFDVTNGTGAGGFARQSYVGLSGGFGEVKLGSVYTAYDDISGATNFAFDGKLSPQNDFWASTGYDYLPKDNFYYATPSFGGISGAVSRSLKEAKGTTATAFHVKYEGGPVYAGLAYQIDDAGATDVKFTRINGSYDLGVAKVLLGYGNTKATGANKITDLSVGADIPMGANVVLSAGYARSSQTGAASKSGYSIVAAYLMSKRTTVYGGLMDNNKNAGVDSRFGVGVKHTF